MPSVDEARSAVMVAIIDDHDVVHAGIEAWCAHADPPISFVGNFLSPGDFVARYPERTDEVDVVLFDLQIDGNRPEFETLRKLCDTGHRVIIYSHMTADEVILNCLDIGAVTYLVKSEGKAHLIEAVHAAATTTPYMGPRMAKALLNDQAARRPNLSEREKEVLVAWFQTESKELVGKRLYIDHHQHRCPALRGKTVDLAWRAPRSRLPRRARAPLAVGGYIAEFAEPWLIPLTAIRWVCLRNCRSASIEHHGQKGVPTGS